MSETDCQCDLTIYSTPATTNDDLRRKDDLARPWKSHDYTTGSTIDDAFSGFDSVAKHQVSKDEQTASTEVESKAQERLASSEKVFESTPARTSIVSMSDSNSNQVLHPKPVEPLSIEFADEARSAISSKYIFTERGVFATSTGRHTKCASCQGDLKTGQRVMEMEDGDWRRCLQHPVHGESHKEIIDVDPEFAEDERAMSEGSLAWKDLTRTRSWVDTAEGSEKQGNPQKDLVNLPWDLGAGLAINDTLAYIM